MKTQFNNVQSLYKNWTVYLKLEFLRKLKLIEFSHSIRTERVMHLCLSGSKWIKLLQIITLYGNKVSCSYSYLFLDVSLPKLTYYKVSTWTSSRYLFVKIPSTNIVNIKCRNLQENFIVQLWQISRKTLLSKYCNWNSKNCPWEDFCQGTNFYMAPPRLVATGL